MIVHKESKTLFLDPSDTGRAAPCPICGREYQPNGTGPANSRAATMALHHLPSEHYLGGFAPTVHDWAYLLCGSGWAVHATYGDSDLTAMDRWSADWVYERLMHAQVERRCRYGLRWWYHLMAERNAAAVRAAGDSSYRHSH